MLLEASNREKCEINAFEMEGDFKPKARQALRESLGKRLDDDQQDATHPKS